MTPNRPAELAAVVSAVAFAVALTACSGDGRDLLPPRLPPPPTTTVAPASTLPPFDAPTDT